MTAKEIAYAALRRYAMDNGLKVVTKGQKAGELNINLAYGNIKRRAEAFTRLGVGTLEQNIKQLGLHRSTLGMLDYGSIARLGAEKAEATLRLSNFMGEIIVPAAEKGDIAAGKVLENYNRYLAGQIELPELNVSIKEFRLHNLDYIQAGYVGEGELQAYLDKQL